MEKVMDNKLTSKEFSAVVKMLRNHITGNGLNEKNLEKFNK